MKTPLIQRRRRRQLTEDDRSDEVCDMKMSDLLAAEAERQATTLSLIPSENHSSSAVRATLSSVVMDKYAEGYADSRYYAGNEIVDQIERLTQDRARKLFSVPYVNVQPYSGSPANLAVYVATCEPGEIVMGLDLPAGGHLTHGWKNSFTAKAWKSVPYGIKEDGRIDFTEVRRLALEHRPRLIWCGGTALPRAIEFEKFAAIADEVGAYLAADISHISGLIVGGQHASPVPFAHIVTTTTHKTLRGPRGAMLMVTDKGLTKDPTLGEKIDKAIIPGLQGGPHMHTIAAIGVALHEAAQPEFTDYAHRVTQNAKVLADELRTHGCKLVTNGTDNHLLLLDLTEDGPGRGIFFQLALERIGLSTNKNTIPNDPGSPLYPSGLRLGTPAATTRGMGQKEMKQIANLIAAVAEQIKDWQLPSDKTARRTTIERFKEALTSDAWYAERRNEVAALCRRFPLPAC